MIFRKETKFRKENSISGSGKIIFNFLPSLSLYKLTFASTFLCAQKMHILQSCFEKEFYLTKVFLKQVQVNSC